MNFKTLFDDQGFGAGRVPMRRRSDTEQEAWFGARLTTVAAYVALGIAAVVAGAMLLAPLLERALGEAFF